MEIIYVTHISKTFNDRVLFDKLSYVFSPGLYHLRGENGSGKSVLLKMLAGIDHSYDGVIEGITDKEILLLDHHGIGVPFLSIRDNIALAAYLCGCPFSVEKCPTNLYSNEKRFLMEQYVSSSIGNQMKVGLSLLFLPIKWTLILLDEAMNGIDQISQSMIFQKLLEITKTSDAIIIIVSHTDQAQKFLQEELRIINLVDLKCGRCELDEKK